MNTHRNTYQKKLILECLKNANHNLSAEDIIDRLEKSNEHIGRATVYRTLKVLEECGEVKRFMISEKNSSCYQYIDEHSNCNEHYHLMCAECGVIKHIDSGKMAEFKNFAKSSFGFEIDDSKTVFYGVCKACKEKK